MTEKPLLCFDGDNAGQKAALRAASRALPMLKPGHSLNFVTLPQGQDPDDLIRASGPKAFGDCLEAAEPLVERLWQSEYTAQPLATPEDRAGLKERLGLHLANIEHSEIRRHYADAFRERFDKLFAQKAAPVRQSGQVKGNWKRNSYVPPDKQTRSYSQQGSDLLLRGILTSFLDDPALISRHRDALADFKPRNSEDAAMLDALISASFEKEGLDKHALPTILGEKLYNRAEALLQGDGKAFGFNRRISTAEGEYTSRRSDELGEAIKLMRQRPALEDALEAATRRASEDLTEENYAEQQRLRGEKEEFDRRLSKLLQGEGAF